MSKRIIALLIILSMLVIPTFAENVKEDIEVTEITALKDGKSLPLIKEEGEYTVNINLTANKDSLNFYIAILLCEGDREKYIVRDMAEISDLTLLSGDKTVKSVKLNSKNASEKFIKVMFLVGKDKSTRIREDVYFPSGDELKLRGIKIQGHSLPDFSKDVFEYTLSLPKGTVFPLEVITDKISDTVNEEITNIEGFDETVIIDLSYEDLPKISYKIKITEIKPEVKIKDNKDGWETGKKFENKTNVYADRSSAFLINEEILAKLPELSSMEIIKTKRTPYDSAKYYGTDKEEWMEIEINNSAEIYIFTSFDSTAKTASGRTMSWLKNEGYTDVISTKTIEEEGKKLSEGKLSLTGAGASLKNKYFVFKKQFLNGPNSTTKIKFKTFGPDNGWAPYFIGVKWIDDVSEEKVTENKEITENKEEIKVSLMDVTAPTENIPDTEILTDKRTGSIKGENAIPGSNILFKIYKPGVEIKDASLPDIIYYNILTADNEGKYNVSFLLDKFIGDFNYEIISDENIYKNSNSFSYNPTADNNIKSMKLNNKNCKISDDTITCKVSQNDSLGGLLISFDIQKDAKMYIDDELLISGKSRVNCRNDLKLKVVADEGSLKEYILKVTKEEKRPSGGGGGGGSSFTSNPEKEEKEETVKEPLKREIFKDVKSDFYAYDAIDYLSEKDIIKGYPDNTFKPDNNITREEFAKVIVNAFMLKPGTENIEFNDVKDDSWYKFYVDIVASSGIVKGDDKGDFGISKNITREDMAVILYRVLELKNIKLETGEIDFKDGDEISTYAQNAIKALSKNGIISGYSDNKIKPQNYAKRAEVSLLIFNLLTKIIK